MSLKSLLKGVDVYQLPDSLSSYIQDKTASNFGKLRLVPFAFPVFIMNPIGYNESLDSLLSALQTFEGYTLDLKRFSSMLRQIDPFALAGDVDLTGPSSGEIWRIDKMTVSLALIDTIEWYLDDGTNLHKIRESAAGVTFDVIDGPIWLENGEHIYLNWALNQAGNAHQIGVIKNA